MNRYEAMNAKCELLEQMGFTINHQDSNVEFQGVQFDFSAVHHDMQSLIYTAMNKMYSEGYSRGRKSIQSEMKSLLGLDNEE